MIFPEVCAHLRAYNATDYEVIVTISDTAGNVKLAPDTSFPVTIALAKSLVKQPLLVKFNLTARVLGYRGEEIGCATRDFEREYAHDKPHLAMIPFIVYGPDKGEDKDEFTILY